MKKLLLIVFALALPLCALGAMAYGNTAVISPPTGEVYGVTINSTVGGILDCVNRAAGTAIMGKGSSVVFVWRMGDGWAMSGFNTSRDAALQKANLANYGDGVDLLKALVKSGWSYLDPKDLPQPILDAIAMGFMRIAGQLTTFAVFPMGSVDPGQYPGIIPNPEVSQ